MRARHGAQGSHPSAQGADGRPCADARRQSDLRGFAPFLMLCAFATLATLGIFGLHFVLQDHDAAEDWDRDAGLGEGGGHDLVALAPSRDSDRKDAMDHVATQYDSILERVAKAVEEPARPEIHARSQSSPAAPVGREDSAATPPAPGPNPRNGSSRTPARGPSPVSAGQDGVDAAKHGRQAGVGDAPRQQLPCTVVSVVARFCHSRGRSGVPVTGLDAQVAAVARSPLWGVPWAPDLPCRWPMAASEVVSGDAARHLARAFGWRPSRPGVADRAFNSSASGAPCTRLALGIHPAIGLLARVRVPVDASPPGGGAPRAFRSLCGVVPWRGVHARLPTQLAASGDQAGHGGWKATLLGALLHGLPAGAEDGVADAPVNGSSSAEGAGSAGKGASKPALRRGLSPPSSPGVFGTVMARWRRFRGAGAASGSGPRGVPTGVAVQREEPPAVFPLLVDVSMGAHVAQPLVEALQELARASRRARAQWRGADAPAPEPRGAQPDVVWCTSAEGRRRGTGTAVHRIATPYPDPVSCLQGARPWLAQRGARPGDVVALVEGGLVTVNASDAEAALRPRAAARLYRWLWRTVEAGSSAAAPVLGPAASAVGVPTLGGGRASRGPATRSLAQADGPSSVDSSVAQQLLRRLAQAPPLPAARGLVYGVLAVSYADATRLARAAAPRGNSSGDAGAGAADTAPWSWDWMRGRTQRLASRGWAVSRRWAANLLGDDRPAHAPARTNGSDSVAARPTRPASRTLLGRGRDGPHRRRPASSDPHVSRALHAVVGAIQAASGDPRGRKRRAPGAAGEHWGRERRSRADPTSPKRQLHALLAAELLSVCHFARTAAALHGLGLRLWRAAPGAGRGGGGPLLRLRASLGTLLLNQDPNLVMDLAPCARALDHVAGCNSAWSCLRGPQWGAAQAVVGLATVPTRATATGGVLGLPAALLDALAAGGAVPWRAGGRVEALFHPLQGLQARFPLVQDGGASRMDSKGGDSAPEVHVMVQVDLAGAYPA